ncbi:MAG: hypothetical protein PHT59_07785 [Candidatus Omnitrophica bacterium]|nr:hypothetical protein [Candidatus Omnitrophota bacterium]
MDLAQIISDIKSCGFEAVRSEQPSYLEVVVTKAHIAAVTEKLNSVFGPPAWPSPNRLSNEMDAVIKNFGGIMKGQTFYFTHISGDAVFAMLWPWSDGDHTTVKIGKN